MNSAVDEDLIEASPVQIRGAGYQPKRRRLGPASIEELDVIVENMPEKWELMMLLASWCALRYGEIAELRRKDIKLRHMSGRWTGVIQIRRGVVWVNRKIQIEPPKSEADIRDVAIPPHLIPIIKEHLETHAAPGQEGLLFPAANGRQQWPSHHHWLLQEGRGDRRTLRSTVPRPAPHRSGDDRSARRDARRSTDSPGPHHGERRGALPAHGQGARPTTTRRKPLRPHHQDVATPVVLVAGQPKACARG